MAKILIFTAEPKNFVPENLAKEAEAQGHESMILDVTHCVIAEGIDGYGEDAKCASQIFVCKKGKDDEEKDAEECIKPLEVDSETIVIPRLNEYNLEMKLSMLQRMQDCGAKLLNSVRSMELCNDKLMSQVVLNTAGIKTPYSFTMQNADDVEMMVAFMEKQERLKFPVVVKTLRGTHGIGVMKLDSRSSLVSVAQMLLKEGIEFMVQEFIKHEQSARMIMIGEELLAANLRGQAKEKDEFRTNSHLGSETEPYHPSGDELKMGRKIVDLFGCNFCAIDYILVGEGEKKEIIVLEVNGSPGLEAISKNWPDRNLPADVIKYATKDSKSDCDCKGEPAYKEPLELDAPVVPETPVKSPHPEAGKDGVTADGDKTIETDEVIQEVEPVTVHRLLDDIEARVDTGAALCSLHVDSATFDDDRVRFKRGEVTYTTSLERTILIKNVHGGESSRRPVIKLDITIAGKRVNGVEFTLTNRSQMKYEVLIGRNALERMGIAVQVTQNPDIDAETEVPESEVAKVEEE